MKRKLIAILLAVFTAFACVPAFAAGDLLISPAPTASAARPTAGGAADALYALGLVGGYGKNADGSVNFALGEKLPRQRRRNAGRAHLCAGDGFCGRYLCARLRCN